METVINTQPNPGHSYRLRSCLICTKWMYCPCGLNRGSLRADFARWACNQYDGPYLDEKPRKGSEKSSENRKVTYKEKRKQELSNY